MQNSEEVIFQKYSVVYFCQYSKQLAIFLDIFCFLFIYYQTAKLQSRKDKSTTILLRALPRVYYSASPYANLGRRCSCYQRCLCRSCASECSDFGFPRNNVLGVQEKPSRSRIQRLSEAPDSRFRVVGAWRVSVQSDFEAMLSVVRSSGNLRRLCWLRLCQRERYP